MKEFFEASRRSWLYRLFGAIVVLAIAAAVAGSNYVTGNWTWATPPKVPLQSQLNMVKEVGINLPQWQTVEQYAGQISGYDWSVQAVVPNEPTEGTVDLPLEPQNPAIVLIRPQTWHRDMPQVEWMDINGVQKWTTDQRTSLTFTVLPTTDHNQDDSHLAETTDQSDAFDTHRPVQVRARFFRGWTRQQTYAVLQWYAWPTGGSSSVSRWFWVDQLTQLRDRHRMPWVAVSIQIPIKPLGDIQTARSIAEAVGQQVQSTLIRDVFST